MASVHAGVLGPGGTEIGRALLNGMAFNIPFVASLWRMLSRTKEYYDLTQNDFSGNSTNFFLKETRFALEVNCLILAARHESISAVLELFCVIYAQLLITMDDDEFFHNQTCFSIDEAIFLTRTLKARYLSLPSFPK